MVVAGIALSPTFQAKLLALAHPCQARFGAANASERPWRTAKPRSADLAFEIRGLFLSCIAGRAGKAHLKAL